MTKTLAIFSHSQNTYSETFIQAHKKLPFNIKFYYGGFLPTHLENGGSLMRFSIKERVEKKITKQFTLQEYALLYSLKREKVDCILAEYGPTASHTLEIAKFLKIPLIVHFHGYDASVKAVVESYKSGYKNVFEYASFIISVSHKMSEALINMGCPKEKIVLSVCGPNPQFEENNPGYDLLQFVSVGRFIEKKAPYLTILAFKKVAAQEPSAKLKIIGEGDLMNVCRDMVIGLNLSNNVEFLGVQTADQIKKIFEESIAFVQHSIVAANGDSEGTPVAILEAQAAALPVIATYHAGIPDVVIHNETGLLCNEKDVEEMANNMLKLLRDKRKAKIMGIAGRERIKENFTQAQHLNSIEQLIIKAMAGKIRSV